MYFRLFGCVNHVFVIVNFLAYNNNNNNGRNGSCLTWLATTLEEKRRWLIIMLPHEDNVLNKFRIWKERHIQMRENRSSHLVG